MEGPTDKWVDLLTNNKSFYVSPLSCLFFSNLSIATHGFLSYGVFLVGEVFYQVSVGLSLFFIIFLFLFLFWLVVFARGWAGFFPLSTEYYTFVRRIEVDKRDVCTLGGRRKVISLEGKLEIIL